MCLVRASLANRLFDASAFGRAVAGRFALRGVAVQLHKLGIVDIVCESPFNGIQICLVAIRGQLDDATKTAVISQRGMGEAIGFSRRGERLKGFINSKNMANYFGRELREKSKILLFFNGQRRPRKMPFFAMPTSYCLPLSI